MIMVYIFKQKIMNNNLFLKNTMLVKVWLNMNLFLYVIFVINNSMFKLKIKISNFVHINVIRNKNLLNIKTLNNKT